MLFFKSKTCKKFFEKISYDDIQNIIKQFNIDIFFDINIKNEIDIEPIKFYFKLKNINISINRKKIYINDFNMFDAFYFFNEIKKEDYYFILKYIKDNIKKYKIIGIDVLFNNEQYNINDIKNFFKNKRISAKIYKMDKNYYCIM